MSEIVDMQIGDHEGAVITIRSKGEYWTRETRAEITDWLGNAEAIDFIEIHVLRALKWVPMTVQVKEVIAVEEPRDA